MNICFGCNCDKKVPVERDTLILLLRHNYLVIGSFVGEMLPDKVMKCHLTCCWHQRIDSMIKQDCLYARFQLIRETLALLSGC